MNYVDFKKKIENDMRSLGKTMIKESFLDLYEIKAKVYTKQKNLINSSSKVGQNRKLTLQRQFPTNMSFLSKRKIEGKFTVTN